MPTFQEVKRSFSIVTGDRDWMAKLSFGAVLLLNPILLLAVLGNHTTLAWITLGLNVASFWFPLGYTMEVLRRARRGTFATEGLPSWGWKHWPVYFREGAVKFCIAFFTLIFPSVVWIFISVMLLNWMSVGHLVAMVAPLVFFFTLPFCAIACCRWLDTGDLWSSALDYRSNLTFYRLRWMEYSIATLFVIGLNTIGNSLVLTLPFILIFGLCLVDTWFGPIYADSAQTRIQA
ncbi:MAG: DUF4013 domain-containing protein [Verrucomicrobiae bacterium]|nr:DUF4013 domain-containing protein [Verrucomicrobiae bacterium]